MSLSAVHCNQLCHFVLPKTNYSPSPWVDCLLFNFRKVFKEIWTNSAHPQKISRLPFVYPPDVPKLFEKMTTCDYCKTKTRQVRVIENICFFAILDFNVIYL